LHDPFCSLSNPWDNLVMAIGSIANKLVLGEVGVALLLKEMRWKDFESTKEALVVYGRSKDKCNKRDKGRSKSHGIWKSPRNSKEICLNYIKVRKFKRDCNEKKKNDYDDEYEKYSHEDGEYSFNATLATQAC